MLPKFFYEKLKAKRFRVELSVLTPQNKQKTYNWNKNLENIEVMNVKSTNSKRNWNNIHS